VYDQLKTYDPLWENHPKVKKIRAESKAEGIAEGRAEGEAKGRLEGELEASRKLVVSVVTARFPTFGEAAKKRVAQINELGALDLLIQRVSTAPDENTLRWLLQPPVA
jgi:flagellar biosynthesis/type III secretory pathway protein FliH